jgi:hypothetical protein
MLQVVVKLNFSNTPFILATNIRKTCVATLALGSWPKQGLARLRAKREAHESHHMLLGVQKVWGSEPSYSHCGSSSPKWTFESSDSDYKGQNPSVWKVFYIIGNLSKHKCLKWACMTHLNIWNTSYGQKRPRVKLTIWPLTTKSRESTPFLGVQVACNILLERFQQKIQVCFRSHCNQRSSRKVMGPQNHENPNRGNFETPTWES